MKFCSTRDSSVSIDAAQAILTGLSYDGGLYVPTALEPMDFAPLRDASYTEVAHAVLRRFLTDYDPEQLRAYIEESYGSAFGGRVGHLQKVRGGLYALELWHGPTAAFKDYALQLMPRLLGGARSMLGVSDRIEILVATSGDTGTAALNGFEGVEGVGITVFYPNDGTSEVQRLQMVTQTGNNVAVYAVNGNFDDAQRGVKLLFSDEALREKLAARKVRLSSANSINWGRLVPQIVYYITSYLSLCREGAVAMGDPVDFCVPTGNFGDIMAGWYAKKLGLPLGRLVCASNQNNVLADFLENGRYNANRTFYKTSSPSMDIVVSSNLERLLYHTTNNDAQVREWMTQLAESGSYTVDADTLAAIRADFTGLWTEEERVGGVIRELFETEGYLADPHTAVAFDAARRAGGERPMVVVSTASPFKFSGKVLEGLGRPVPEDEFEAMAALEAASGQKAPESLRGLRDKPVRFSEALNPADLIQALRI